MIQTACPCCPAIILTPDLLDVAWLAAFDAFADHVDGLPPDAEEHAAHLPAHQREPYRHGYTSAYEAVRDGATLHAATTAAEDAIRGVTAPAGLA